MSGELESYLRVLDLNTPNCPGTLLIGAVSLTLFQRERDGGGGQPPVKSEVKAQSNKVGRLWFWGVDAQEYPGGLLRLDPAFAYAEPPSS